MSSIARAVGGEFPISEEQFHLWNSPPASAIDAVETRFGVKSAGLWLTFGRNALGVALDLCGVSADATLAMPAYQCGGVIRKIASRTQNWRFYETDEALNPVIDDFMNQVQGVRAVLTTVYFGASLIETHLTA